MTAAVLRWARRQQIEDATLTAVLIAVADAADAAGVCSLSQPQIGARAAIKERAVRSALVLLESFDIIRRETRGGKGIVGRQSDQIWCATDRNFQVGKAEIMAARKFQNGSRESAENGWPNRHQMPVGPERITGTVPVGPEPSRVSIDIYSAAAPDIDVFSEGGNPTIRGRISWEESTGQWRARVRFDGVELDLGRHAHRAVAWLVCRDAVADIEHTSRNQSGVPRQPVDHYGTERLDGAALSEFLFGSPDDRSVPLTRTFKKSYDEYWEF